MEIVGYIGALLIGLLLGITGSGGSILALPLLVGLFAMPASEAVGASLFIVAATSTLGAGMVTREKAVDWTAFLWFGLPSVVTVVLVRRLVTPHLPERIAGISRDDVILFVFAAVMIGAALAMLRKSSASGDTLQRSKLLAQGFAVGGIAGFVGAGGGFMIVPALVLFAGIEIHRAAATSIVIICVNSAAGFVASLGSQSFDWPNLVTIVAIAMVGLIAGRTLTKKIDQRTLRTAFAYFLFTIAIYLSVSALAR